MKLTITIKDEDYCALAYRLLKTEDILPVLGNLKGLKKLMMSKTIKDGVIRLIVERIQKDVR